MNFSLTLAVHFCSVPYFLHTYADEDDNDVDGDDDNVDGDNGNADGDDDDAD